MKPRLILALVGEKSSGKSVVFNYLGRQRGVSAIRFSDILNDILRILQLDERDRGVQGHLGEILRQGFGGGVLVTALLARAAKSQSRIVVLDGLRKLSELKALRQLPHTAVLYITAPAAVRWQRAKKRAQRRDDQVSFARFKTIEKTYPAEIEIPAVGRRADARIDNIGSERDLFRQVNEAMKQLAR